METLMGVQWRLDVIVLSRACKRQKEPQMILQLETNKGLVNMTVTPQDLEDIEKKLKQAKGALYSPNQTKIQRYIR